MIQIGDNHWIYRVSQHVQTELKFKALVEDTAWEEGENHTLSSGENSVEETPYFSSISLQRPPAKATRLSICYNAGSDTLALRGNAPGLAWDRDALLVKQSDDLWTWESTEKFKGDKYYKVVRLNSNNSNDVKWEEGPNHALTFGEKIELDPRFF